MSEAEFERLANFRDREGDARFVHEARRARVSEETFRLLLAQTQKDRDHYAAEVERVTGRVRQLEIGYDTLRTALHRAESALASAREEIADLKARVHSNTDLIVAARAEAERLARIIDEAPHAERCRFWLATTMPHECDCWKAGRSG